VLYGRAIALAGVYTTWHRQRAHLAGFAIHATAGQKPWPLEKDTIIIPLHTLPVCRVR